MQPTPSKHAPKRPKVCVDCSTTFQPQGGRQVRCLSCRKQRGKGRHEPLGAKPCATCGQDFQYHPKLRMTYCSQACDAIGRTGGTRTTSGPITYTGAHMRLTRERGRASDHQCQHCDAPATQWAYDHSDPDELTDHRGRPYSTDPSRHIALCTSCHTKYDRRG